jgi:hypothetical protein
MELQDFVQQTEESITLGELAVPREEAVSNFALNTKASSHLAAQVSMINDPEALLDNFNITKNELGNLGVVRKHTELWENALNRSRALNQQALSEIVADNAINVDTRADVITSTNLPDPVEPQSDRDLLSESLLTGDMGEQITTSGEAIRASIFESVRDINRQKREAQSLINAQFLLEDRTLGNAALDLVELIIPFAEWAQAEKLLLALDPSTTDASMLGTIKEKLTNLRATIPLEDRAAWTKQVVEIVNANSQIIFPDGNDLAKKQFLEQIIMGQEYSDQAKWFDNFISVIDVTGMLGIITGLSRAGKATRVRRGPLEADVVDPRPTSGPRVHPDVQDAEVLEVVAAGVRSGTSPTSVARNASDTNAVVARSIHETVAQGGEEAAEALYGTTRIEAIGDDILPQTDVTKVGNRVEQAESSPQFPPNQRVTSFTDELDGGTRFFKEEIGQMVGRIKENVFTGISVTNRTAMNFIRGSVEETGGGFNVAATYGPRDGGFVDPINALEAVKFQFREYGLGDDALTLLVRQGGDYVPTSVLEEAAKKELADTFRASKKRIPDDLKPMRDYMVGVDFKHDYNVRDITDFSKPDVGFNWFDRFNVGTSGRVGTGSLQQHILDAHSTLHPQLTLSANAQVDRGAAFQKALVEVGKDFADKYSALPKESRARVANYFQKANHEGIAFNPVQMKAAGFNTKEIETARAWRQTQDTNWWVLNHDMGKTMHNRNYGIFVGADGTTELFARPISRNNVGRSVRAYDSSSDTIVTLSKQDLDDLYSKGGEVAQLRTTMAVTNDSADFIINQNKVKSGYIRAITGNDKVLSYRDGYFPVMYDGKEFVFKTIRDANGLEKNVAVATARNSKDAAEMVKRLEIEFPDSTFFHKTDKKASARDISDSGEAEWQVMVNSGLSAQKRRGERLVDASADSQAIVGSNLVDPVESVTASIRSMSQKVNMRDWFEATKTRFIKQYASVLPTKQGEPIWPANRTDITGSSKMSADARTTFDWVSGLENGYFNLIDEGWKAVVNTVAEIAGAKAAKGSKAAATLEEWAWAFRGGSPTRKAKGLAFKAYLASNPLRQIVIQSHQAIQLNALDPIYTNLKMPVDVSKLVFGLSGFSKDAEVLEMVRAFKNSGFIEAVDTNNLVRADLQRLADLSVVQKGVSASKFPLRLAQRVGFDTGEQFNLMTAWLFFRNRAIKAGKPLTSKTYEEIAGEARNFTFNMNAAGDMPYNQNSISMIAQFLQVPHKALTQMLSNRALTRFERGRVAAFSTVMYGVPTASLGVLFANMEQGPTRDLLERGLETMALNYVIEKVTGVDTAIDFGGLAPSNLTGITDFLTRAITGGVLEAVAESPSGALFFGANPRLTEMFKVSARYFSFNDFDDPELETGFGDLAVAGASIFSGYSNAFKGAYAFETGTKMSSTGRISDYDVSKTEAIAQFFGLPTIDETAMRNAKDRFYNATYGPDSNSGNFLFEDVSKWFGSLKRHLARRGKTVRDDDYYERVLNMGMIVFERDGPRFQQHLLTLLNKDFADGDMSFMSSLFKKMGIIDPDEYNTIVELLPEGQQKDILRDAFKVFMESEDIIRRLEDG